MKSDRFLSILLTGAIIIVSPSLLLADHIEEQCKHAVNFISQGDLQGAQSVLDTLLRKKPKHGTSKLILGVTLVQLSEQWGKAGDRTRAMADVREALSLDPDEAYWHSALAKLLHAQGDAEEATGECSRAAQLSPEDSGLAEGCGFGANRRSPQDPGMNPEGMIRRRATSSGPAPDMTQPVPLYKPDPPYAEKARTARLQGTVVLWITTNVEGGVEKATVVKPLGLGLDQNSLHTVLTWRFQPATRDGKPAPRSVMVQVSFRLF